MRSKQNPQPRHSYRWRILRLMYKRGQMGRSDGGGGEANWTSARYDVICTLIDKNSLVLLWVNYNLWSCKTAPKGSESDNSEVCDLNNTNVSSQAQNFPWSVWPITMMLKDRFTVMNLISCHFWISGPSTSPSSPRRNRWARRGCEPKEWVLLGRQEVLTYLRRLKGGLPKAQVRYGVLLKLQTQTGKRKVKVEIKWNRSRLRSSGRK